MRRKPARPRRFNGGAGVGVMVAHGVNLVANHGTAVVLLSFLEFLNGRVPCFVGDIKNFNGFGVGFIPCLGRINVDSATDEEDLVGGREISRTRSSTHGHQAEAVRRRPRDLRTFKLRQTGNGRLR